MKLYIYISIADVSRKELEHQFNRKGVRTYAIVLCCICILSMEVLGSTYAQEFLFRNWFTASTMVDMRLSFV